MKTIFSLIIFGLICFSESKSNDEWILYKTAKDIQLSSITSLALDSSNRLFFPASQKIFLKDSIYWKIITNSKYDDPKYTNLKSFVLSNTNILWGASELGFMNYDIKSEILGYFDRKDIKGDWNYGYICGLTIDDSNNVWFTSRTPFLSKFNGTDFVDYDIAMTNNILQINYMRSQLIKDSESNIWVTGDDGILSFSTKSSLVDLKYIKYSLKDLSFSGIVSDLAKDKFNNFWCSSRNGELAYYNGNYWEPFIIPDSLKANDINNGKKNFINKILINNLNQKYLFWYLSNYFLVIDSDNKISKRLFPENMFQHNIQIQSAIIDSSGGCWLGTNQDGLIYFKPIITDISESNINVNVENLLPDIYVRNIYPNPTKSIVNVELLIYPKNINELKISVFNVLGVEILDLTKDVKINYQSGEASCILNLDSFNSGIYFLCVSKGKDKSAKLIFKLN